MPEPKRAKHRQVEHAGRPALQDQRIDALPVPQPPPDRQQNDGKQRRCHEAQLKREQGMFDGIAQQEGEAEEEQQDPKLRQRIPLHEPARQRRQDAAKGRRLFCRRCRDRGRRGFCHRSGNIRPPGVDRRGNVLDHRRGHTIRGGGLHRFRRVISRAALLKRLYALAQPGNLLPRCRTSVKPYNRKHGRNQQRKNQE